MGSLCMDIVDHELKRHGQWREDLARRKRAASDTEYQQAANFFGSQFINDILVF